MTVLKTLIDVFISVLVLFMVVVGCFHLVEWLLLTFEDLPSDYIVFMGNSRVGILFHMRNCFLWELSVCSLALSVLSTSFLADHFGIVLGFIGVCWFLHLYGSFFFNAIRLVALFDPAFYFSVAYFATVETLTSNFSRSGCDVVGGGLLFKFVVVAVTALKS